MIVSFRVSDEILDVMIDEERRMFFRGKLTNNQFIKYGELVEKSGQGGLAAEITERRVACKQCLRDDKEVEFYVIDELVRNPVLQRLGVIHIGTRP